MKYADLYFGLSDSRNEAIESHDAFLRSYVDLEGAVESVLNGKKFLVLGPKGTGKTALAWYLKETEFQGTHLATVRDASDLPLQKCRASRLDRSRVRRELSWPGNSYCCVTT